MRCHWTYKTPEGFDDLVMVGDDEALTGLAFKGSRGDWWRGEAGERRETPAFRETRRWLDAYFAGRDPGFTPPFRIEGATQFRRDVLDELMKIPFGATTSYGDIAKAVARRRGGKKASARAVGGAVGWNPIGIIIPCHRVVGSDGGLTGYGGGLGNKVSLLAHEGADLFDVRISAPTDAKTEIDEKRVRLCLLTVNKAAARHGLGRAKCDRDGGSPMIRLDGIIQFGLDAPYIFGECGDEEAKTLLESFMDFQGLYHYDLALQLARLMAEKGSLVRARMGRVIAKTDWSSYGSNGLLLSYLGSRKHGGSMVLRLLDIVPEDVRDGLFVACWHLASAKVQTKLRRKFEEWTTGDPSWGGGSGEAGWLVAFLSKWMCEGVFTYEELQPLMRWHLERATPSLLT